MIDPPTIFIPIPYEDGDDPEHNHSGFCADMTHECHENQESIHDLEQAYQRGEVSTTDIDNIYRGRTVI
jgi:hypothetical protein